MTEKELENDGTIVTEEILKPIEKFTREEVKENGIVEVSEVRSIEKDVYIAEIEQKIADDDAEITRRTAHKQELQDKLALLYN